MRIICTPNNGAALTLFILFCLISFSQKRQDFQNLNIFIGSCTHNTFAFYVQYVQLCGLIFYVANHSWDIYLSYIFSKHSCCWTHVIFSTFVLPFNCSLSQMCHYFTLSVFYLVSITLPYSLFEDVQSTFIIVFATCLCQGCTWVG